MKPARAFHHREMSEQARHDAESLERLLALTSEQIRAQLVMTYLNTVRVRVVGEPLESVEEV